MSIEELHDLFEKQLLIITIIGTLLGVNISQSELFVMNYQKDLSRDRIEQHTSSVAIQRLISDITKIWK